MRAVVQRVSRAEVHVDSQVVGKIGKGLLIYLGVEKGDSEKDLSYMADKTAGLRIFDDEDGVMNLSVQDVQDHAILVVSQFTLYGDTRKGRRPSYNQAASPDKARAYYEKFVTLLKESGIPVETGRFQAHMDVHYTNDGPITILVDSHKKF